MKSESLVKSPQVALFSVGAIVSKVATVGIWQIAFVPPDS